jgi:hypothetical protein
LTRFTLVMAYYENAGMLLEQIRLLLALPLDLARCLDVIVVDDGSPTAPAIDALSEEPPVFDFMRARGIFFRLYRMGVDVRWNQDACRNIGVREAKTRWVLLTDMDHVVPAATWRRLMCQKLKKERAYRFARVNAPALDPYKPHPNSWALTTDRYWLAGGYDEALAGHYGTDGDFKVRLQRSVEVVELPEHIIRYPREVIPDASTTTLERKSEADRVWITTTIKARQTTPGWRPLHFSFPCARVL